MSDLAEVRSGLRTVIADALPGTTQVFATIPERVAAPFVAIGPGDPYIEFEGVPFGGKRIRLAVTCVVTAGTNDLQADALDDLLLAAAEAVDATGEFVVERILAPGQIAINGQPHLGATLSVLVEV